jgi:DNA-binding transcriptional LysR family regulator
MELRQLEHFVAVAEERHFTNAAARCHIAQSALSRSILLLEQELGAALLVRTTRLVELTESGRQLLAEARRTLEAAASARAAVDEVQGLLRGTLSIGAVPTGGLLDLPLLLSHFHQQYPAIEIQLLGGGGSTMLIEAVQTGRIDLALVTMPTQVPARLHATPLATQPYVFMCAPSHPLADRPTLSLDTVACEPFVDFQPGAAIRAANDHAFGAADVERRVPFQVDHVSIILDVVAQGLGVAIVPRYVAAGDDTVRWVPLSGPLPVWTLCALTPAARLVSPSARKVLELVVAECADDRADGTNAAEPRSTAGMGPRSSGPLPSELDPSGAA